MNAAALLCDGRPEAIALIEDESRLTYSQLRARVMQAALGWRARGVSPGDRAVIALLDGVDWVAAFLGLIWIGAVPIAISPRTETRQISDLLDDSGAKVLLMEDQAATAAGALGAVSRSAWLSAFVGAELRHLTPVECTLDTPAFMLYSSGTTGKPKGVVHAHRALECAHAFARDVLKATVADRFYSTSKLFFAYPLANSLFAGLRLGAAVVLDSQWPNPVRVAEVVRKHAPTLFFSVPTLYRRLLEANVVLASIRVAVSAGEACPPALVQAWESRYRKPVVNGYGTTETLVLMLYQMQAMAGLRATPLTRIRAQATDDADPERGIRLWFSHPAVALGYSRVVTHDSAQFVGNEFSPGDMFRAVAANKGKEWIYAGRTDQLLKVHGRWVDTLALENRLSEKLHDKVKELCIVPFDSAAEGTIRLHLFTVPQSGAEASLAEAVVEAISDLPSYQKPAGHHVVAELPRTETGKLRRAALKERILKQ